MRFGIFVACAGRQAGGPETYERNLVKAIAGLDSENEYHVYCLAPEAGASLGISQENIQVHVLWPSSRWISVPLSLPLALLKDRVKGFHATFVAPPISPVDLIFTMHDVTPFVHPEFYPPAIGRRLRALIHAGLRSAKLILCISDHAKQTSADYFKIPLDRMVVVHHGISPRFAPMERERARQIVEAAYGLTSRYVLYVGKLEPRKNLVRLLEAFKMFEQETEGGTKLVMAGRRTWQLQEIDETVRRLRLEDRVVEIGYVPDEHMPALYSGAELFAFPTLWEGFGIPVLEAMASGTPVVTSTVTAIPEIAGGAALLVDPARPEDIAESMHRIYRDSDLRRSLREKGLARAREFTWRNAAEKTIEAYRRVMGG